ncbi:MAG: YggT family protein, partial [Succinivibrio sp.]
WKEFEMSLVLLLGEAVVILFELRSLMQSSPADYYHPFVQLVARITQPVIGITPFRQSHIGWFFYAGALVALIFALVFWAAALIVLNAGGGITGSTLALIPVLAVIMWVKCLGYLFLALLLVEAITSWLPSTRGVSYLCAQITSPLVAPVQKIIPPIGMIDISLMLIMIALFALNGLMARILGPIWLMF